MERVGLRAHLDAGLPPARAALADALRRLADPADQDDRPGLAMRVMVVFIERFAWHGRRDWDAAVALDPLDGDAALDALAEFLYKNRHSGRAGRP
jgi:hypothetical protein